VPGPDAHGPVERGRRASLLVLVALGWGVILIAGALVVPVYGSATLVGENGAGVLVPVAIPAVVSAAVWVALHVQCSRGGHFAALVARVLIAALCAFCLVAILSIGVYVLPVVAFLAAAALITPSPVGD
jgi:hypothetical protein